jgi:hypothetical protein
VGHSGSGMMADAPFTVCNWLRVEPDHLPSTRGQAQHQARAGQDRSSGRALYLDGLGLARSLAGGSTADAMIRRTGVRESALGEQGQARLVPHMCHALGAFAVKRGNSRIRHPIHQRIYRSC